MAIAEEIPQNIIVHIYQTRIDDFVLNIRYYANEGKYTAEIRKGIEKYRPTESEFETHTCESLIEHMKIELRNDGLLRFIGLRNKRNFLEKIDDIPIYFSDTP